MISPLRVLAGFGAGCRCSNFLYITPQPKNGGTVKRQWIAVFMMKLVLNKTDFREALFLLD
jgi:hypothetical protein